ncbi:hypothetical protein SELMODRAFT_415876 [Selaginella moellendorffii]|uniref:SET domain-containing protein n=1 Tax=Selaginella moellendorffii TaxID=88036 RepID=D8RXI6_SELML|nr:hypothetical protein SELMODRAFT_415876 [Selaginella moellendorffii]
MECNWLIKHAPITLPAKRVSGICKAHSRNEGLTPNPDVLRDLRQGKPIFVLDEHGRLLVAAASLVTEENLRDFANHTNNNMFMVAMRGQDFDRLGIIRGGWPYVMKARPSSGTRLGRMAETIRALGTLPVDRHLFKITDEGQTVIWSLSYAYLGRSVRTEERAQLEREGDALIREGKYCEALQAALAILAMDPWSVPAIIGKAKSLLGLGEYELAFSTLSAGVEITQSSSSDMIELLGVAEELKTQAITGNYDRPLLAYFSSGAFMTQDGSLGRITLWPIPCPGYNMLLSTAGVPQMADFFGDFQCQASELHGRGLFATKALKAGDLIFATRPLAMEDYFNDLSLKQDILNKVSDLSRVAELLHYLDGASRSSAPPPNSLLVPSGDMEDYMGDLSTAVDPELESRVEAVVRAYTERGHPSLSPRNVLWPLLTLINHCCVPTITLRVVGFTLFCRAARDLKPGEELLSSYGDGPLRSRVSCLRHLGNEESTFDCQCVKCTLEAKILPQPQQDASEINVREVEESLRRSRELSVENRQIIRSAYGFLYYKEGIQSVLPDAEVIMDAVHRYANSKLVFHSCLRLQSQLLRGAKNREAGREILLKSCVSHFGVSLAQELVVRVEHGAGAF